MDIFDNIEFETAERGALAAPITSNPAVDYNISSDLFKLKDSVIQSLCDTSKDYFSEKSVQGSLWRQTIKNLKDQVGGLKGERGLRLKYKAMISLLEYFSDSQLKLDSTDIRNYVTSLLFEDDEESFEKMMVSSYTLAIAQQLETDDQLRLRIRKDLETKFKGGNPVTFLIQTVADMIKRKTAKR